MSSDTPATSSTPELLATVDLLDRTAPDVNLPNLLGGDRSTLAETVDLVANARHIPAVSRLDLLGHTVRSPEVPNTALRPLATSLLRPGLDKADQEHLADELIARVSANPHGDPLGRSTAELIAPRHGADASEGDHPVQHEPGSGLDPLILALDPSIGANIWNVACHARQQVIGGEPSLVIDNELFTTEPLNRFYDVVNPLQWPECSLQQAFFRSMVPQGDDVDIEPPDSGWRKVIRETVDFSLGLGFFVYETDLTFTFWDNTALGLPQSSIGCTYELARSVGDRITCDRGFLLVEDVGGDVRRVRTLKEVRFTEWQPFVDTICPVWSYSSCLIVEHCLGSAT